MNRSLPSTARGAFRVLACLLMGAAACTPNQGVKPGAPQLIELTIVQGGGASATTIRPDTPDCTTGIASLDSCLPAGRMADAADGGTLDANVPPDGVCRQASANNWCTCAAPDEMKPDEGLWNCDPFANVTAVIAVFDRLLDTAPFEPGTAPVAGVMTTSATPAAAGFDVLADYSATGDANGLVFNLFGPMYFGNFRGDGPSLFGVPQPEFPSGATVMVSLQADKVHAKDGKTPYMGSGQLLGGTLIFTTAPFAAVLLPPDAMAMDPNAVTVAFTNMAANPKDHLSATANGVPIAIQVPGDVPSSTFAITPMDGGGAWPTGATIVVKLDATTTNLLDQTIDAAATVTFTAP
jgi:hypothetical protein